MSLNWHLLGTLLAIVIPAGIVFAGWLLVEHICLPFLFAIASCEDDYQNRIEDRAS